MKRQLFRNTAWIALIAVWGFLAGAYFHLGWVRDHSISYLTGFIIGGIGVWIVFSAMGILVYRFAKNNGNTDPAKLALGVVSFFTACLLLVGGVKYGEVKKDKFVEDLEHSFILHYKTKALDKGIEIEDLEWKLNSMYSSIYPELRRHPQLEELMQLKTADAVFEENKIVAELCIDLIQTRRELGYPLPAGMEKLFE